MRYLKYFEIFNEGMNYDPLYHSCRLEHGILSLKNNKMLASTKQYFFKNNNRGSNRDQMVIDADNFYGISTTRDKNLGYGGITFVFDKAKLKTKYKIIPFDWDGRFKVARKSTSLRHSKYFEREEFVVVSKDKDKYLEPLHRFLVGFYLSGDMQPTEKTKNSKDHLKNSKDREYLTNHPLFLGYYDGSKFHDRELSANLDFSRQMNKMMGIDVCGRKIESLNQNSLYSEGWEKYLPHHLTILKDDRTHTFKKGNVMINPDLLEITYENIKSEVGYPSTLEFDIYIIKKDGLKLDIDITYGDLVTSEFSIKAPNVVEVIQYTSYGSKFDPSNTVFALEDESLQEFVNFLNKFDGMKLSVHDFTFLDKYPNSYIPT